MSPNETIAVLAEKFPSTFFIYEQRRRPLKIGIYHDLVAEVEISK